jgi:hypothetical protein
MTRFRFFEEPVQPASEEKKNLPFEPSLGKHRYDIEVKQEMIVNHRSFVNTTTAIQWEYTVLSIQKEDKKILLETTSYELEHTSEANKALTDFGLLFNQPVTKIELALHPDGTIKSVLNQSEIFEKWQKIKHNELANFQADESMKGIFVAGDTEFSNTMNILSQNPLYLIFFEPIYGGIIANGTTSRKSIKLNSRLFQGKNIQLHNHQVSAVEHDILNLKSSYVADPDTANTLNDLYHKDYQSITGSNFYYDYKLLSFCAYSIHDGSLSECAATCTERANDNLIHNTYYTIKKMN